jgi:beta-lactam-binding protein with PASTA domain
LPGQVPNPPFDGEGEVVPPLVGRDVDDATDQLQDLGFRVTSVPQHDTSVPAGTVIAQAPPGGVRVTRGSAVTLLVADGGGAGGGDRPPATTSTTRGRGSPGSSTTSTTRPSSGPTVTIAPIG